jgi:ABC-type transport system substrate-binding protein
MPNKLTSVFALALTAALTLAACSPSPSAAPPTPTPTPSAAPAPALEAAGFCRPRECGPVPICTANSVATCTPDTGCRWKCVPLISPI